MSNNVINTNIMSEIAKWLEENNYIKTKSDIDSESWDQLKAAILIEMGKSKGGEKVKDPLAPKRGKSAYIFFCAANRSSVKNDIGESASMPEVSKELGVRWNKLKESTKQTDKKALGVFEADAVSDKTRYEKEMEGYVRPSDDELTTTKKSKKAKVPDAPKRGKSGYIFFCSAKRSDVKEELGEDAKTTEITSRLGELWTELKDDKSRADEFEMYLKMASDDKDRYLAEKAEYTSGDSSEDSDSKKSAAKKPAAKKSAAKKPVSKKTDAKKPAAKKPTAKKPAEDDESDNEEELEESDDDNKPVVKKPAGKKK